MKSVCHPCRSLIGWAAAVVAVAVFACRADAALAQQPTPRPPKTETNPIALIGIVKTVEIDFCQDGINEVIVSRDQDGKLMTTRVSGANPSAAAFLKKAENTRQRVFVAGYMGDSIEGGCRYLSAIYAGPASEFDKLLASARAQ